MPPPMRVPHFFQGLGGIWPTEFGWDALAADFFLASCLPALLPQLLPTLFTREVLE